MQSQRLRPIPTPHHNATAIRTSSLTRQHPARWLKTPSTSSTSRATSRRSTRQSWCIARLRIRTTNLTAIAPARSSLAPAVRFLRTSMSRFHRSRSTRTPIAKQRPTRANGMSDIPVLRLHSVSKNRKHLPRLNLALAKTKAAKMKSAPTATKATKNSATFTNASATLKARMAMWSNAKTKHSAMPAAYPALARPTVARTSQYAGHRRSSPARIEASEEPCARARSPATPAIPPPQGFWNATSPVTGTQRPHAAKLQATQGLPANQL